MYTANPEDIGALTRPCALQTLKKLKLMLINFHPGSVYFLQ